MAEATATPTASGPKGALGLSRPLPWTPEELTAEWFSSIMEKNIVIATKIMDAIHSTSSKILIELTYAEDQDAGPTKICVKGGFNKAITEQFPELIGAYQVECGFFYHLAPRLSMRIPQSYWSTTDTAGQGLVVMEDLRATGLTFGDILQPWTPHQVKRGLEQLADLHAKTWGAKQEGYPWVHDASGIRPLLLNMFSPDAWKRQFEGPPQTRPPVPERIANRKLIESRFKALWNATDDRFQCIVHGDPHIGNTFITTDGEPGFLDWQGLHIGSAFHDVAFFIVGTLTIKDRRENERNLVSQYLEALHEEGGPRFSVDEVWEEYRMQNFHGIAWALAPSTMQPAENVSAMTLRHCAAIEDHETIDLLQSTPQWQKEWPHL